MVKYEKTNLNQKDIDGFTALMCAYIHSGSTSSVNAVRFLLESGADLNVKTNDGLTILDFVQKYETEARPGYEKTALHPAATKLIREFHLRECAQNLLDYIG